MVHRPDAAAPAPGEIRLVDGAITGMWPQTPTSFPGNDGALMPNVIREIRLVRCYSDSLAGEAHLHDRVNGAIGRFFKVHPDPVLRDFFRPGITLPVAIPGDRPVRNRCDETRTCQIPLGRHAQ